MTDWPRFQEVDFNNEPDTAMLNMRIAGEMREVVLLAQTDTHPSVFGYLSRQGNLILIPGGYLYQSRTDWRDQINAACEQYGADEIPDTYAQCNVYRLPSDRKARRNFIRAINRIDARCAQEYSRKEVS